MHIPKQSYVNHHKPAATRWTWGFGGLEIDRQIERDNMHHTSTINVVVTVKPELVDLYVNTYTQWHTLWDVQLWTSSCFQSARMQIKCNFFVLSVNWLPQLYSLFIPDVFQPQTQWLEGKLAWFWVLNICFGRPLAYVLRSQSAQQTVYSVI